MYVGDDPTVRLSATSLSSTRKRWRNAMRRQRRNTRGRAARRPGLQWPAALRRPSPFSPDTTALDCHNFYNTSITAAIPFATLFDPTFTMSCLMVSYNLLIQGFSKTTLTRRRSVMDARNNDLSHFVRKIFKCLSGH
ncbi:hypothetical protein HW555_007492 [Spodoptera exigua]|uniref:Uncharacterized protein n=1 Tax=Spodoptera exigua TaxID=7107 RepID=A0A835GH30_SPOEX|nr:hypothetical protein HW555_007492 [Spodoptera exigua]